MFHPLRVGLVVFWSARINPCALHMHVRLQFVRRRRWTRTRIKNSSLKELCLEEAGEGEELGEGEFGECEQEREQSGSDDGGDEQMGEGEEWDEGEQEGEESEGEQEQDGSGAAQEEEERWGDGEQEGYRDYDQQQVHTSQQHDQSHQSHGPSPALTAAHDPNIDHPLSPYRDAWPSENSEHAPSAGAHARSSHASHSTPTAHTPPARTHSKSSAAVNGNPPTPSTGPYATPALHQWEHSSPATRTPPQQPVFDTPHASASSAAHSTAHASPSVPQANSTPTRSHPHHTAQNSHTWDDDVLRLDSDASHHQQQQPVNEQDKLSDGDGWDW